jgi:hypothetical protein
MATEDVENPPSYEGSIEQDPLSIAREEYEKKQIQRTVDHALDNADVTITVLIWFAILVLSVLSIAFGLNSSPSHQKVGNILGFVNLLLIFVAFASGHTRNYTLACIQRNKPYAKRAGPWACKLLCWAIFIIASILTYLAYIDVL